MKQGKVILTLDRYMNERSITRYQLSVDTKIRYDTINNYYRNRVQRYDSFVLAKICAVLDCSIADIIKYVVD